MIDKMFLPIFSLSFLVTVLTPHDASAIFSPEKQMTRKITKKSKKNPKRHKSKKPKKYKSKKSQRHKSKHRKNSKKEKKTKNKHAKRHRQKTVHSESKNRESLVHTLKKGLKIRSVDIRNLHIGNWDSEHQINFLKALQKEKNKLFSKRIIITVDQRVRLIRHLADLYVLSGEFAPQNWRTFLKPFIYLTHLIQRAPLYNDIYPFLRGDDVLKFNDFYIFFRTLEKHHSKFFTHNKKDNRELLDELLNHPSLTKKTLENLAGHLSTEMSHQERLDIIAEDIARSTQALREALFPNHPDFFGPHS